MADGTSKPRIALAADDAGYPLKESIRKYLEQAGYAIEDLGTWSEQSLDYPDFGKPVAERVVAGRSDLGIAVCGTGMGISIAANKVPGARANVLALGGRPRQQNASNAERLVSCGRSRYWLRISAERKSA